MSYEAIDEGFYGRMFCSFLKTNRPPSYSRSTVDKLIIALGATEQLAPSGVQLVRDVHCPRGHTSLDQLEISAFRHNNEFSDIDPSVDL
ncbi:hypothetical protein RRG08_025848 [Elysia crispata]|uniref:Uncharacterized protein n=1 Tax=Elysia crispata TaxID=231223 RepID=A0AAE1CSB8_9GAST|nr:hypothetical protein RRG08_025848 [Elysia crispata]